MVGTAITIAIADGSKAEGERADVRYNDSWTDGRVSRQAKLDWLTAGTEAGTLPNDIAVERDWLDDMRPRPFQNGEWINLRDCFIFASSGQESKRDHIVYGTSLQNLESRVRQVLDAGPFAREKIFNSTSMNTAHRAQTTGWVQEIVQRAGYRPLDRRWHYNHAAWNDRPRPNLRSAWGEDNICLFAMPGGTNAGPAVWCFANYPDRHAFRGSYGGYAFPLYDRREGEGTANLSLTLTASLSAAYGEEIVAEDVFDAILCLLSASSYSLRFAEDLEDVFPHIPFPADPEIFAETVRIGREIRAVETFARPSAAAYRGAAFCRLVSQPHGNLAAVEYADGVITLCEDGSGEITGLPGSVWSFAVSGYRLLPRWLEARVGLPVDLALVEDIRDICGRIAELIDLFAEADTVLNETLQETLTRAALGLAPEE